ncbi:hypothetical protein LOD99_1232 [Oopsacas minuta]|uniref:Uncharacterized protein n=1 Tax=Oopsacas minuta TaxID=111878 RepID=A0AAV7K5F0_9METZ|nr:hypothetical protein LOD99_1232 [Oopsacas minuta]
MDTEPSSIPIEPYSDSTRPSTGSSFYSGITSPSGSSEDEFFDAPESLGSHGHTREDSVSEPRISTPLVSTDILPILHPDEIPHNPPSIPNVSDSVIPLPTTISVLDQFNRANVPLKEEDFSSLESLENPSETETVTASFNQRWTSSPNIETYPITEERVIPGFNGTTTNILTFLSPNSDSANKEFTFKPIEQVSSTIFSVCI